jgi:hypothetical protein
VEVFKPASKRGADDSLTNLGTVLTENTASNNALNCCIRICCSGNVFSEPLPGNGQCKHVAIHIKFYFEIMKKRNNSGDLGVSEVKKLRLTAAGIRCADHVTPSIRKSWH